MARLRVTVENLDKVEATAKEILEHVEAIRKLQTEIGPYNAVSLEMCFDVGKQGE